MKKRILAMVLSMAMAVTMLPATSVKANDAVPVDVEETFVTAGDASPEPVDNLARTAEVTATHSNSYFDAAEMPKFIKDGNLDTQWNCWNAAEDQYPMEVKLTWTEAQTISSMRVMWWADNDSGGENWGVQWPSAARVQYKDGENWTDIKSVGVEHEGVNGQNTVWNVVGFAAPVTTTELRMLIEPTNKSGMGISEWEVFGGKLTIAGAQIEGQTELAEGQTADYTGSATPLNREEGSAYEWSVAADSASLIEIQGVANAKNVTVKGIGGGNATLHLKVTKDGVSRETDFVISVKSEETLLAYDLSLLPELGEKKADFELITTSQNGYAITWESSNPAVIQVETSEDGKTIAKVIRSEEGQQSATLTATITGKEGETKKTANKSFIVSVPKKYLASYATVTGSYNGGWGGIPDYVKDENNATGWNGCRDGGQDALAHPLGETDWIQYSFEDKLELTGAVVSYKDDNGGVVVPSKVEFQYTDGDGEYDETTWKTVTPDDGWTYVAEEDNNYNFNETIVVKQIRLKITNGKTRPVEGEGFLAAAYIWEWGLIGKKYVKPTTELETLESLITKAKNLNTAGKDEAKVAALNQAIAAAEAVTGNKNPLKAQVDAAYNALLAAYQDMGGEISEELKKDISTLTIAFVGGNVHEYTGSEIKPAVTVKDSETALTADDFTVEYPEDLTSVGTKTVTIKAAENSAKYKGNTTKAYNITARTLTQENTEITLTMPENVAAGAQIRPGVTVKVTIADGNVKTLTANTDYTVAYGDNNTSGTDAGSVIITGKSNYTGSVEKKFDIAGDTPPSDDKTDMSTLTVTFTDGGEYEYTGVDIQPMATVKDGQTELSYGSDFMPEYPNEGEMSSVGQKTVTIRAAENSAKYKGSKTATYEIKARTLTKDNTEITITPSETQANPTVSVKVTVDNYDYLWYQEGSAKITNTLTEGTDFTVEYGTGDKEGTVTITGIGNYTGSVEKGPEQEGTKIDLKEAVITVPNCTYNKKAQTPEVTVKVGENTLVKDTDYTVAYENNTNAGTAKAVITAVEGSAYTGTAQKEFTINKASAKITAKDITKIIGEKNFSFGATVDSKGTLSYKSKNTKVIKVAKGKAQIVNTGTAKITITAAATANYKAATKTITIKVNKPKKATLSKVESKKSGQLKVTWKKDAKATGYKVMYSTDKKFKNKKVTKTITVKKNKTVSKTIKKLKKGKKYYVKVCSYVKVGKKEYLGAYSKVKNVKIKK